jgi:hypothetical protein
LDTTTISIYGAILSTVLASWQFWRAFQERRRISVSYSFRSLEDLGNDILLINSSPKIVTLYHIQLFWGRRHYLFWMRRYQRVGDDPWDHLEADTGVSIEPFKISTIRYTGDRHFNWHYKRRTKAILYLQARIVGRVRPITLIVYRQSDWRVPMLKKILSGFCLDLDYTDPYIDEKSKVSDNDLL